MAIMSYAEMTDKIMWRSTDELHEFRDKLNRIEGERALTLILMITRELMYRDLVVNRYYSEFAITPKK